MSLYALIAIAAGFCLGIGIETLTDQNEYVTLWLLGLACVVGLVWRRAHRVCPAPHLYLVSVLIICTALGMVRTQLYETQFDQSLQHLVGTEVTLTGEVTREPDRRTSMQMLYIAHEAETILVSTDRALNVSYGDTVTVIGRLDIPENFTTDLGRTFNYTGYLKAKRVEYRMSFADVTIQKDASPSVVGLLLTTKQSFMNQLDSVLTEPEGSLADGLLLGLNQGLGDKLEEDFRRSGIVHIVVLSGYNIMLVVAFVMFVLSFLIRERLRMLFGLGAIVSFALIVGLSATVVRASVMAGLLLIAQTFNRSYDVLRALLLAGVVMLIINPYLLLFDIGFQLSFMATLGLIAVLPLFAANEQPEIITSFRGYAIATIATQIAVLPLLIYHIGEVSLVSVFVNLLVLPVVPFAMFSSFVAGIISYLFPVVGLLFGFISSLFLSYIIIVAEVFSDIPFATLALPQISAWWIVLMYAAIGYLYWYFFQREVEEDLLVGWTIEEEVETKTDSSAESVPEVPKLFR